jgi:phosphatidylglycerophosphate synthase
MRPVDTAVLALFLAILATMPAFALKSRQRPPDADVAARPTTLMLGFWVRDWFMWLIGPVERPLIRARVAPDLFNYLGVGFGAGAGVSFALDNLPLAGALVACGGICDILDGRLARALNMADDRGAFLDSTLDRFAETFTFLGIAWRLSGDPRTVLASILAITGSLLVSYARARGEALGVQCKGGLMQRAERLVVVVLAGLFDGAATHVFGWQPGMLLALMVGIVGLGATGTAVYRTAFIAKALRLRKLREK